ncbi:GCF1 [Candida metapsilosis]|uniref:GCF1 n=1 Tax=Candida metapsilosis TaxID=273372 RepID=A0A8H7ZC76_9ASCO|nr:GCF1 [Candida metapsilosis]
MMRLMINPGRALASQLLYKPLLINASISHHQTVKFLTTTSAKQPKDKKLQQLKDKLKRAKDKQKKLEKDLKDKERYIKKQISERKQKAIDSEKDKLKRVKEAKKQKAYVKDTLREPRPLTVRNFYAKATKTPVTTLNENFDALSEPEKEQYKKATEKYNAALKAVLTPKPELGPTTGYQNFVSQNYPPNVTSAVAMRQLAEKWKTLSQEEKESFNVPEDEAERIKSIQKKWEQTREKEYPQLLKFKKEYNFTI